MNKIEIQEKEKLELIKKYLHSKLENINEIISRYEKEIKEDTIFRGEASADMDHAEKINFRQSIEEKVLASSRFFAEKKRIKRIISLPYFGRFDFITKDEKETRVVYLGIHGFDNNDPKKPLIYDWRAPISSMFYNYELGEAKYEAPNGEVSGEILLKRQLKIVDGEIEFVIESGLNITDDVLQKELSRSADDGMKNIVATIQRDQNSIIRNDNDEILIIQGTAGSGKTSIALHRIAFLLYRFKETLKTEDILIISPNKVFADYIANVLPELGEESVSEIQIETLATDLLDGKYNFETFFEQTAKLLENEDEKLKERINFKSSQAFLNKFQEYIDYVKENLFSPRDIKIKGLKIKSEAIQDIFQKNRGFSKKEVINKIVTYIGNRYMMENEEKLPSEGKTKVKKLLDGMYLSDSLLKTYQKFFDWIKKPNMFQLLKKNKLEYADVFPLIYLKLNLEGRNYTSQNVKHLVVDEMQDYTAVQYAVINKLFDCHKTILGDAKQSINPYSSSTAETIKGIFSDANFVILNKSYRSSYEIMQLAQKISYNPELEVMKRHGEDPVVLGYKNKEEEFNSIVDIIEKFKEAKLNSLAIICKTQKQAEEIHDKISKLNIKSLLLDEKSASFNNGIIITTAYMAKGLEFDWVIINGASSSNYKSLMDRNLLYVACTRAMHHLFITHEGELTPLIDA